MINIRSANIDADREEIQNLFWEYLSWANAQLNEAYQINFDIETNE